MKKIFNIINKIIFEIASITFGVCLVLSSLVIACYFNIELLWVIGLFSLSLISATAVLNDIFLKKEKEN